MNTVRLESRFNAADGLSPHPGRGNRQARFPVESHLSIELGGKAVRIESLIAYSPWNSGEA